MLKKLLSRTAITAVIILVQIVWIVALLLRLSDALPVMNYVLRILSLVAVLHVIKNDMDPSYKVSWVLFIALLPLFGGLMYVLFGNKRPTRFIRDKLNVQLEETMLYVRRMSRRSTMMTHEGCLNILSPTAATEPAAIRRPSISLSARTCSQDSSRSLKRRKNSFSLSILS